MLLSLYGLGTNIGLKRISSGEDGEKYKDLVYVRRRFLGKEQLRSTSSQLSNEILSVRLPQLWGEKQPVSTPNSSAVLLPKLLP